MEPDGTLYPIPGKGGGIMAQVDQNQSPVATGFGLGSPKFMNLFSMSNKT